MFRVLDNDYKVLIRTGRSSLAGIDPKVYLQLQGEKGASKKILLKKSNEHLFEKNQQDTFSLAIPDIGHVRRDNFCPKSAFPFDAFS